MNYLLLLITVPVTVFAVAFLVSNPQDVEVALQPFDGTHAMPLGLAGLVLMGAGFFLGALFVWLNAQTTRFRCWKETRRANKLEKELADLQSRDVTAA